MELFWKALTIAICTAILSTALSGHEKQMNMLLALAAITMVGIAVVSFYTPIIRLIQQLSAVGNLQNEMIAILVKATIIGFCSEMASIVCTESGNAALGKAIQLLSASVIFYLSIPIFSSLLEMIQKILGEL